MCLEKAQPYTWLHQQELLRLASNKNNLWNAVEKMVERCWNFPKIFGTRWQKILQAIYRNVVFTQESDMRIVLDWRRLVNRHYAKKHNIFFITMAKT